MTGVPRPEQLSEAEASEDCVFLKTKFANPDNESKWSELLHSVFRERLLEQFLEGAEI